MPTYNDGNFLKYSIESILNQSFKDFEFIIINDSSTDNTDEIVQNYIKDNRIKYIKNKTNIKMTASLNIGLNLCSGMYIARMDGDDISHSNRLEKQYEYLEKNKKVFLLGTNGKIIDTKGELIGNIRKESKDYMIRAKFLRNNQFIHSSTMFRREVIKTVGLYNEEYVKAQDYDYFLRIAMKYRVANLSEELVSYRDKEYGSSVRHNELQTICSNEIREKFKNAYPYSNIVLYNKLFNFLLKLRHK